MEIQDRLINIKNIAFVSYDILRYYQETIFRIFIYFIGGEHTRFDFENKEEFEKVWNELKEKLL